MFEELSGDTEFREGLGTHGEALENRRQGTERLLGVPVAVAPKRLLSVEREAKRKPLGESLEGESEFLTAGIFPELIARHKMPTTPSPPLRGKGD